MAIVVGFEPTDAGVMAVEVGLGPTFFLNRLFYLKLLYEVPCLTTWLHDYIKNKQDTKLLAYALPAELFFLSGGKNRNRTDDSKFNNLMFAVCVF